MRLDYSLCEALMVSLRIAILAALQMHIRQRVYCTCWTPPQLLDCSGALSICTVR